MEPFTLALIAGIGALLFDEPGAFLAVLIFA